MKRSQWLGLIVAVVCAAAPAGVTRADVFRDVAFGLGFAGFDIQGQRNILSGGADLLVTQTFQGNPLDFGVGDLTLQGPISFQVATGGRGLSTLDISFQTAFNAPTAASPLSYAFNTDVGGQSTTVNGSLFIDAGLSINGFGFYDLDLSYSSRQTVGRQGRFVNSTDEFDFDVGPISVSGNVFADALALVTAPIFDATNTVNPFESFSGAAKLKELLAFPSDGSWTQLAASSGRASGSLAASSDAAAAERFFAGLTGPMNRPITPGVPGAFVGQGVVPEPTVMLLMLIGVPVVIARPLRHLRRGH